MAKQKRENKSDFYPDFATYNWPSYLYDFQ